MVKTDRLQKNRFCVILRLNLSRLIVGVDSDGCRALGMGSRKVQRF